MCDTGIAWANHFKKNSMKNLKSASVGYEGSSSEGRTAVVLQESMLQKTCISTGRWVRFADKRVMPACFEVSFGGARFLASGLSGLAFSNMRGTVTEMGLFGDPVTVLGSRNCQYLLVLVKLLQPCCALGSHG